jgi:dGTPase
VPVYAAILDAVETSYPGATEHERFQESLRHLIDGLVSGLIEGTVACARASGVADVEGVRHLATRIVCFSNETGSTSREIKRLLTRQVYLSRELADDRLASMERLAQLFEYLMARPDLVPNSESSDTESRPLHRAVCDYIAGMTDGYFKRVYTALLG